MSGNGFLNRYLSPQSDNGEQRGTHRDPGVDAAEGYVAMLDLEFSDGNRSALPYSMLMKAEYDPSVGITLRYSTEDVVITGQRLEALYKSIIQHRERRVSAAGNAGRFDPAGNSGGVVTAITCTTAEG